MVKGDADSVGFLSQSVALSRAALLARRGRLARAEALLLPLAADPQAPAAALDLLARVYAQQGRLEQAQAMWARAVEKAPADPRYRAALDLCARLKQSGRPLRPFRWAMLAARAGRALGVLLAVALVIGFLMGLMRLGEQVGGLMDDVAKLEEAAAAAAAAAAGAPAPDLRGAVEAALAQVTGLGPLDVAVVQEGDTVRLAGHVSSLYARYAVESAARAVPGVGALDLTQLRIVGTYVVQAGDSLSAIAAAVYGAADAWPALANANRIEPPYSLRVGQVLEVPLPVGE